MCLWYLFYIYLFIALCPEQETELKDKFFQEVPFPFRTSSVSSVPVQNKEKERERFLIFRIISQFFIINLVCVKNL